MHGLGLLEDASAVPDGHGDGDHGNDTGTKITEPTIQASDNPSERVCAVADGRNHGISSTGGTGDVEPDVVGGGSDERSEVGCDVQANSKNNDTDQDAGTRCC